jgi:hypothetical protein
MFRRETKVVIRLTDSEYRLARECLMNMRNKLLADSPDMSALLMSLAGKGA